MLFVGCPIQSLQVRQLSPQKVMKTNGKEAGVAAGRAVPNAAWGVMIPGIQERGMKENPISKQLA